MSTNDVKNISILGSTGSIGIQALDIVRQFPDKFNIVGLTTNKNSHLLQEQIDEFHPQEVAISTTELASQLRTTIPIHSGESGIKKIATMNTADTVINALVGTAGILPTLAAIQRHKTIALANKETLVSAGEIITKEAIQNKTPIIPIDSEHSAILQCINGENRHSVNKITLTCSGGPFRNKPITNKRKDALHHPTWKMGDKITIDCSTLMNKGFEVIETHWLYNLPYNKIKVIIHPESVVHCLVEFKDSSSIAQLSPPNMRLPIQYALTFPERLENSNLSSLNLELINQLSFEQPNLEKFPCLGYAYEAGNIGGTMPAALNEANDQAVRLFLNNKINFTDIPVRIKEILAKHHTIKNPDINDILKTIKWTQQQYSSQQERDLELD